MNYLCVISRSLCSLVCKWTYQADPESSGWDASFFREIGLDDLLLDNCSKIGMSHVSTVDRVSSVMLEI